MIAVARSSCKRATASSPRVASSDCSRERSSPISAGAVSGAGWSSAVACRAQPPTLLTTSAPRRMNPPCSINFWVFVRIALSCYAQRPEAGAAPCIGASIGRIAPPIPLCPPRLREQPHLIDLHPAVGGLYHVVNRQQRHRHRRQRLHFHSRAPHGLGCGTDAHAWQGLVERGRDLHMVKTHGMTQRNQLRRALRRERARHLADRQCVPLRHPALGDEPIRLGRHPDRPFGYRRADGDALLTHVHHAGAPRLVNVRQPHAGSARSPARAAAASCGFTLPCAKPRASSTCAIAGTSFPTSPPEQSVQQLGEPASRLKRRLRERERIATDRTAGHRGKKPLGRRRGSSSSLSICKDPANAPVSQRNPLGYFTLIGQAKLALHEC